MALKIQRQWERSQHLAGPFLDRSDFSASYQVRAIDLADVRRLVLAQTLATASSGGSGAGAGFHADPPDDAVCDAWTGRMRRANADQRINGSTDQRINGSTDQRKVGPKGAFPKKFPCSSPPRIPRRDAGFFTADPVRFPGTRSVHAGRGKTAEARARPLFFVSIARLAATLPMNAKRPGARPGRFSSVGPPSTP